MTSGQDATLRRYHDLMKLNASAHVLRAAVQLQLLDHLAGGQATADDLAKRAGVRLGPMLMLLSCLEGIGLVEKYGDDYALSPVAKLLCDHDRDLGDLDWSQMARRLSGDTADEASLRRHLDRAAATQWIHTPAAMQVAAILADLEGEEDQQIVDLGCGSGVWSSALAYRLPQARVTAVDRPEVLAAARQTAESVELHDRWTAVEIDDSPAEAELADDSADLVLLGCRLHPLSDYEARRLLHKAAVLLRPGGWIAVVEHFPPQEPSLDGSLEALRIEVATPEGRVRDYGELSGWLELAGFADPKFTYLPASHQSLGLLVARLAISR